LLTDKQPSTDLDGLSEGAAAAGGSTYENINKK
jgi:hypothetical protein